MMAADNSTLLLLNVRGNQLEGDAQSVESCGNLVQLDISQNKFTGDLPASTEWDELATYRAGGNQFSGRFPMKLTTARILEHLDISNNRLSGIIPHQVISSTSNSSGAVVWAPREQRCLQGQGVCCSMHFKLSRWCSP